MASELPLGPAILPTLRHGAKLLALLLGCAGRCLQAQEFTVAAGIMQTDDAGHSHREYEVAYRQNFTRNFAASVSYINEGHWDGHHRDGSALELWGRLPFAKGTFSVALGGGIYYFYDTQRLPDGDSTDVHGTAPIEREGPRLRRGLPARGAPSCGLDSHPDPRRRP